MNLKTPKAVNLRRAFLPAKAKNPHPPQDVEPANRRNQTSAAAIRHCTQTRRAVPGKCLYAATQKKRVLPTLRKINVQPISQQKKEQKICSFNHAPASPTVQARSSSEPHAAKRQIPKHNSLPKNVPRLSEIGGNRPTTVLRSAKASLF